MRILSQIPSLVTLRLGKNQLTGAFLNEQDPAYSFSNLVNLQVLDLHCNKITSLPSTLGQLAQLRELDVSENELESVPFDIFASSSLVDINARKNRLSGMLIKNEAASLSNSTLRTLDLSSNQLTHICPPGERSVVMASVQMFCVSRNRLEILPDLTGWGSLHSLIADENSIAAIPDGFTTLEDLKTADFTSNDIRVVPAEIAQMDSLTLLKLSGNPLRDKKFSSMDTEDIKLALLQRLEPIPDESTMEDMTPVTGYAVPIVTYTSADTPPAAFYDPNSATTIRVQSHWHNGSDSRPATPNTSMTLHPGDASHGHGADEHEDDEHDHFSTPPSSPYRSRSHTLTDQLWSVKAGGILDRSNTQSMALNSAMCAKVAAASRVTEVQLHHNLFSIIPDSLALFAETLTALSLSHNQLAGDSYFGSAEASTTLNLPALKELNLANNTMTSLDPLLTHLCAPRLEKLDASFNRIAQLPLPSSPTQTGKVLRDAFPELAVVLLANNVLVDLEPEAIRGMRIVDVSNNEIAQLNPRLGLLGDCDDGDDDVEENGGQRRLERLEVKGNRFKVPRWNVVEMGTGFLLGYLKGRIPADETE